MPYAIKQELHWVPQKRFYTPIANGMVKVLLYAYTSIADAQSNNPTNKFDQREVTVPEQGNLDFTSEAYKQSLATEIGGSADNL